MNKHEEEKNSNFNNLESKFILNKLDNELFDEEENVKHLLFNVKRISKKNEENWEIRLNNKIVFTLKGKNFNVAENNFLKTVEGLNFIILQCKQGVKSTSKFKEKLKSFMKESK